MTDKYIIWINKVINEYKLRESIFTSYEREIEHYKGIAECLENYDKLKETIAIIKDEIEKESNTLLGCYTDFSNGVRNGLMLAITIINKQTERLI